MSPTSAPLHGGPDGGPPIAMDFSTNAHPLGPNPWLDEHIRRADRSHYPDPAYTELRERLGLFHGVAFERVVIGASASELIWRLTQAWSTLQRPAVVTDERTFGEYLRAARAMRLCVQSSARTTARTQLLWYCNPDNPSGAIQDSAIARALQRLTAAPGARGLLAIDLAYWPFRQLLREQKTFGLDAPWSEEVVQLWSPNKLHGLTGVRAAYLILPARCTLLSSSKLLSLAPSWLLGADGVALLAGHTQHEARRFLDDTIVTLREWKARQDRRLTAAGWKAQVSELHFGLWQPPLSPMLQRAWHARLRLSGIKVRDARSFGRPGWVRLVTRAPHEVAELITITERFRGLRRPVRNRAEVRT